MTRPAVEKNLNRSIKWSDDWMSNAEQWMDNFHDCRGDLIKESFHLELWRMTAIISWIVIFFMATAMMVKP